MLGRERGGYLLCTTLILLLQGGGQCIMTGSCLVSTLLIDQSQFLQGCHEGWMRVMRGEDFPLKLVRPNLLLSASHTCPCVASSSSGVR